MKATQPMPNTAAERSHNVCPREMFVPNEIVQNGNLDGARSSDAIVETGHMLQQEQS